MSATPHRARIAVLVTSLVVIATALPGASAVAQAGAEACDRGWYDVEQREDIAPEGVIAVDPDDPWVAGGSLLGGGRRVVAVLHGLGDDAELELPTPPAARDSGFMAIASADPDAPIWAVGFGRETDDFEAYVARRDDDGWGHTESIRPDGFHAALTDVDASDGGTWAVGFLQGEPGDQRPWAVELRDDGHTGHRLPLEDGERASLTSVSVADDGTVWVVGVAFRGADMEPYLARRVGGEWERFVPDGQGQSALADIEVSGDEGWMVGHRMVGGRIEPLILAWEGQHWAELEAPASDHPTLLTAVSHADGVLTVAGTRWDPSRHRYAPYAARLVDGRWQESAGRGGWGMGSITDVVGDPGASGWAVGRVDDGLITRVCLQRVAEPSAPPVEVSAVEPAPSTEVTPEPLTGTVVAVDVTEAAGLPAAHQSWGATAADFDGDGWTDLFIGRHGARARLHLNDGGTYVESDYRFGGGDRHACAAADIDASGVPDLYCAFGASRGTGTKHNQLWLDPGLDGGRLHPAAGGATEPLGRGRQPRFFDIDEDGDLDLFVGQETKRMDGLPSVNRGYLAVGPAQFEATPLPGIDSGLATEAIDIADYDGDGRADMLLVYWDKRAVEPREGIRLYRNEPGTAFTDVTADAGIESIGERDALLADLDGDGTLDLVQLSPERVVTSVARDGRFERAWETSVDAGTALAAGDADGDGDVDLYVLQGKSDDGAHDVILRNEGDGAAFSTIDVPEVRGGSEDDVIALDYDADGRTDFLALNGRNSARGPVQLIRLESAD